MTVTLTSKGQITIPLALRTRLNLKAGDHLELDETTLFLSAKGAVNRDEWEKTFAEWSAVAKDNLKDHPWENQPSSAIINDLRGRPTDNT